jgi:hypothetical protein
MAASILKSTVLLMGAPLLTVSLKHSRLYSIANLSSHEVLSGTELMGESYRELFKDFLVECNNGRRWWYLLDGDETDNSSSANLFGTTKQKLTDLMVGAKLAKWRGQVAPKLRLLPDKIKSLCVEYRIDSELDQSRLQSYTSQRRVICIGKGAGPTTARDQFSGEYLNPPRIKRRGLRRVLLDRLDCLLQTESETETEEQVEEEEEQQQQESSARAEELQNKQSIEQASYETKRDAILTNNFLLSVLESSFFQHDFLSSKRTHLLNSRRVSWTRQTSYGS